MYYKKTANPRLAGSLFHLYDVSSGFLLYLCSSFLHPFLCNLSSRLVPILVLSNSLGLLHDLGRSLFLDLALEPSCDLVHGGPAEDLGNVIDDLQEAVDELDHAEEGEPGHEPNGPA